jgi:hypothetical protein
LDAVGPDGLDDNFIDEWHYKKKRYFARQLLNTHVPVALNTIIIEKMLVRDFLHDLCHLKSPRDKEEMLDEMFYMGSMSYRRKVSHQISPEVDVGISYPHCTRRSFDVPLCRWDGQKANEG